MLLESAAICFLDIFRFATKTNKKRILFPVEGPRCDQLATRRRALPVLLVKEGCDKCTEKGGKHRGAKTEGKKKTDYKAENRKFERKERPDMGNATVSEEVEEDDCKI